MIPRLAVVTATIGDQTDPLQTPTVRASGVQYLCISDRPLRTPGWERLPCEAPADATEATWTAREWKLRLLDRIDADVSLWIDAAYRLDVDPRDLLPSLEDVDVRVFPHPDRRTVAEEARAVLRRGVVDHDGPIRQAAHYQVAGLPPDPSLASTGFLLRRHTPAVEAFGVSWWTELVLWDHPRDQLSVNYALWRTGQRWGWLDGHYRQNAYATFVKTADPLQRVRASRCG